MANEDKLKNPQKNRQQAESNAERDQDHGSMNNGEIGGNMGVIGSSKDQQGKVPATVAADTGGRENNDSKA